MIGTAARRDPRTIVLIVVLAPLAAYFLWRHALPRLVMTEANYGEYYWPRRFWLLAHAAGGLLATDLVALAGPLVFGCLLVPLAVVETSLRAGRTRA